MSRYYTGIGSRRTPEDVLQQMHDLAEWLCIAGYFLRSGGAPGADSAFEMGAGDSGHIYLPWPGFNGRSVRPGWSRPSRQAYALAKTLHPAWERLESGPRALHARNCHQVLGDDLATPSAFVVCWTPDGCETEAERTRDTGGTATAIVLACRHGIPVFNLRRPGAMEALQARVEALRTTPAG